MDSIRKMIRMNRIAIPRSLSRKGMETLYFSVQQSTRMTRTWPTSWHAMPPTHHYRTLDVRTCPKTCWKPSSNTTPGSITSFISRKVKQRPVTISESMTPSGQKSKGCDQSSGLFLLCFCKVFLSPFGSLLSYVREKVNIPIINTPSKSSGSSSRERDKKSTSRTDLQLLEHHLVYWGLCWDWMDKPAAISSNGTNAEKSTCLSRSVSNVLR